jgi:hypothetical protein
VLAIFEDSGDKGNKIRTEIKILVKKDKIELIFSDKFLGNKWFFKEEFAKKYPSLIKSLIEPIYYKLGLKKAKKLTSAGLEKTKKKSKSEKFCHKCGKIVKKNAKFCEQCGAKQ